MSDTRLHAAGFTPCPWCGNLPTERRSFLSDIDDDRLAAGPAPIAGDATLCADCWRLSIYTADGTRRRATEAEYRRVFDRIVAEYGKGVAAQINAAALFGHQASALRAT